MWHVLLAQLNALSKGKWYNFFEIQFAAKSWILNFYSIPNDKSMCLNFSKFFNFDFMESSMEKSFNIQ
jgi:hypothetical protein